MRTLFAFLLCSAVLFAQGPRIIKPTTVESSLTVTSTGSTNATAAASTKPVKAGSSAPSGTCSPGEFYIQVTATPALSMCGSDNAWHQVSGSGAGGGSFTSGSGALTWPWGAPRDPLTSLDVNNGPAMLPRYLGVTFPATQSFGGIVMFANPGVTGGYLTAALYDQATCTKVVGSDMVPVSGGQGFKALLIDNGGTGKLSVSGGDYFVGLVQDGSGTNYIYGAFESWLGYAYDAVGLGPQYFEGSTAASGSGAGLTMPNSCGGKTSLAGTHLPLLGLFRKP